MGLRIKERVTKIWFHGVLLARRLTMVHVPRKRKDVISVGDLVMLRPIARIKLVAIGVEPMIIGLLTVLR
jgi:hypothetical protein